VAAQKLGQAMRRDKGASATPLESVQQAAAQLEKAAEENSARVAAAQAAWRASSSSGPASTCATTC
jgi:ubiquinone biosynthesis protein UbiJ